MVFNSLVPGLHSARTMSPFLSHLSCVFRVAAPQFCPVQAKRGCLFTLSRPHPGSKDHRGSNASLPLQLLDLNLALLLQLRVHLLPPTSSLRGLPPILHLVGEASEMRLSAPSLLPHLNRRKAAVLEASLPLLNLPMKSSSGGETFRCLALCRGQLAGLSTHCNAFLQCSETPALKKTDIGGHTFVTAATHMLPGVGRRKRLMEHILDMTTKHKFNSCKSFGSRAKTSGGIAPCATQSGGGQMTFQ